MAHNPEGDAMSLMGERHVLSILAFLVERGRSTKSDIYANISRGARMPDKLEALEREGLIEMAFPNGSSRAVIELTEKGHRVGDIVVMLRDELQQDERQAFTGT